MPAREIGFGGWAPFVSLNGEIVPALEAKVSVFDRGILLGDGVYETVRARNGKLFRWPAHRERLVRSLRSARIPLGPPPEIDAAITGCLRANRLSDARLRITITRGVGGPGFDLAEGSAPNVIVAASPWRPLPEEKYRNGVKAIVSRIRQTAIESLDPALKSISRIHLALARMEAVDQGAHEALLLGSGGEIREGTSSNVFLWQAGRLRTPAVACGVLEGITRELVLEIARAEGIACEETRLERPDLASAEEIFFTNTSWGALPVTRLDGEAVGSGVPGPLARQVMERISLRVEEECR
ncbi:MAG TPA: aminotransferase class IV [Candidatus Polarisedimenticolia bacterium]|nr:aminotransferase class IV [Candidatus Polarisedimenticolia bacterium]